MRATRKDSCTPQKFWSRVDVRMNDECWKWTGPINKYGYGIANIRFGGGKIISTTAHRISWRLCYGDVDRKLDVAHRCKEEACVNPTHLYISSRSENTREIMRRKEKMFPYQIINENDIANALNYARGEFARSKLKTTNFDELPNEDVISFYNVISNSKHPTMKTKNNTSNNIMPCGHHKNYVVSSREGTNFCLMCEYLVSSNIVNNIKDIFQVD